MKNVFSLDLHTAEKNESGGTSGLLRDPDGVLVHSQDMYQNLMIQMAIESTGGYVSADENWQIAFEQASVHLAKIISS